MRWLSIDLMMRSRAAIGQLRMISLQNGTAAEALLSKPPAVTDSSTCSAASPSTSLGHRGFFVVVYDGEHGTRNKQGEHKASRPSSIGRMRCGLRTNGPSEAYRKIAFRACPDSDTGRGSRAPMLTIHHHLVPVIRISVCRATPPLIKPRMDCHAAIHSQPYPGSTSAPTTAPPPSIVPHSNLEQTIQ